MLFLHLFYLGSEERHKVTTPNCVPLGEDGVVWEHAVLFLHLFYLGSEERHKATTPNCVSFGGERLFILL